MRALLINATLILAMALSHSLSAETAQNPELTERLAQAQARLNLSEEQKEQMAPVMQDSLVKRKNILSNYGIDLDNPETSTRPGFRQARAMRSEMQAVQADTIASLETILSAEQLEEFKVMQEEQRAEMRERMRSGMSAQ